jgi:hypothetical protein
MSAETYSALFSGAGMKPSLAAQKYHALMTQGLSRNGADVTMAARVLVFYPASIARRTGWRNENRKNEERREPDK